MLNHITIMGRFTRDPELRRTGSGVAVASFTLAVDRDFTGGDGKEKEVDFIDCVAWRNTAEHVAKHFTKGRMAVAAGRLQIRSWTDKEGNKRRTAEVVADTFYFADSNPNKGNNANQGHQQPAGGYPDNAYGGGYGSYSAPAMNNGYGGMPASDYAMLEDDDGNLPF